MQNTSSEALSKFKVLLIVLSMPNAPIERMLPQQKKCPSIQNTETHNKLLEITTGLVKIRKPKQSDYSFHVRQNTSIFFSPPCHERNTLLTSSFHYLGK